MSKITSLQWNDFKSRFQSYNCPLCNRQFLDFANPRYGENTISVSCAHCGNVVAFDVDRIIKIADKIDEGYRADGLR